MGPVTGDHVKFYAIICRWSLKQSRHKFDPMDLLDHVGSLMVSMDIRFAVEQPKFREFYDNFYAKIRYSNVNQWTMNFEVLV
jgi:hypothetical protein